MDKKSESPGKLTGCPAGSPAELDQSALYLLWLDSKRREFRSKLRRINNRIRRTLDKYGSNRPCRS